MAAADNLSPQQFGTAGNVMGALAQAADVPAPKEQSSGGGGGGGSEEIMKMLPMLAEALA